MDRIPPIIPPEIIKEKYNFPFHDNDLKKKQKNVLSFVIILSMFVTCSKVMALGILFNICNST